MRAHAFLSAAGALALLAAQQVTAQTQQPSSDSPSPVHVTIPPGGLMFNFSDIDRNNDRSISVEEWNAFVASLQARAGQTGKGGAAAGGTAAGGTPDSPKAKAPSR